MDEAKLAEIDERRARVLRDGTAAGALRMAADDVPDLVAAVRRLTAALATARREGAEGMRQRCAVVADGWRSETGDDIAEAIRALPLDAPGGGS